MAYQGDWFNPETDPYHTGRFTGFKGNEGFRWWDPAAGQFQQATIEDYNRMASDYRDQHGERWLVPYTNEYGIDVFGVRPESGFYPGSSNGESTLIQGPNPYEGQHIITQPGGPSPVPGEASPNPDFVDPGGQFKPIPEGGFGTGYPGSGGYTPPGGGGDTSWDWAAGGGGVGTPGGGMGITAPADLDFSYRPGQDSPVGTPGLEGGNMDFYRQQIDRLLGQQEDWQQRATTAALRNQEAQNRPPQQSDPWSWAYGGQGLPDVRTASGTADSPSVYSLRQGITPGETTNAEIMRMAQSAGIVPVHPNYPISDNDASWNSSGTSWSQASNPQQLYGSIDQGADQAWRDALTTGMNWAFVNNQLETPVGGGPTAAPGYALPVGVR